MKNENSAEKGLESLCDPRWKASRLGLERTFELLRLMGNPERQLKFVHVTGTNGKGSTAAMIASALIEAGLNVGLFTSPYLERMNEEIQVNRIPISDLDFEENAAFTGGFADRMEDHPSEFEMLVCTALEYFLRSHCDIVVAEVGMGGLRDATNVIPRPEAAVVTPVSLDHTGILGNTLEEIAAEKAGIIKPGCDVILSRQAPEAEQVLRRRCEDLGCPLRLADPKKLLQKPRMTLHGLEFLYRGQPFTLPLIGRHQLQNAAVALTVLEALRGRGWQISDEAIRCGLAKTSWPGRLELLLDEPLFLLDGAHNPQGAQALADALAELMPGRKFLFLAGVLADKDRQHVFAPFLPMAVRFVTVTPDSPRALPGEQLAGELRTLGAQAESCNSVSEGVERILSLASPKDAICAFGSLYQAGAVRAAVSVFSRPPYRGR